MRRLFILAPFLGLVLLLAPGSARAGVYDVYSCHDSSGHASGVAGWISETDATGELWQRCGEVGYFGAGITEAPAHRDGYAKWIFTAPDGTSISALKLTRSALSFGGDGWTKGYALFQDTIAFDRSHLIESCYSWWGCNQLGGGVPGAGSELARANLSAHRLIAAVHCIGDGRDCPATWDHRARFDISRAVISLSDASAPAFSNGPHGSFLAGGITSGVQRVSVGGVDAGGGLYRVGVEVDGKVYGSQPVTSSSTCHRPATVPVPCPLEASGTYSFDTRQFPDGTHTVRIALSDVAGNTTYSEPRTVTIRNHERPNGINASRDVLLSARFNRHGRYRSVRYGGRPVVVGRLRRTDGTPIIGAQVAVLGRSKRPGSQFRLLRTPTTTRTGRFRVKLPKGPSRYLRVGYRAYDLDPTAAAQRRLSLDVHAGVRLTIHPRTVRNGHAIVFRGRLLGGPGRRGTLVTMQETTPRPLTFMTLHADRHGRFHATYRFRYTYRLARFRFRALVQHQAGYPYAAGRSRALSVVVLP